MKFLLFLALLGITATACQNYSAKDSNGAQVYNGEEEGLVLDYESEEIAVPRTMSPKPLEEEPIALSEGYNKITENTFLNPKNEALSTFSIDVDNASYSNVRRMLNYGSQPVADAVRIEEMINYFNYDYAAPKDRHPFAIHTEVNDCPWNEKHQLIHIGLQGYKVDFQQAPANNLVFLLDVSGSMSSPNKLPLVKSSMEMILTELRAEDRVAIVVYAGAAGLVLPSTSAADKEKIMAAIDRLSAGGSTAGGAGIQLAYKIAKDNFIENGNNRIVLCTDGDFNVGVSSQGGLENLIVEKRKEGTFLTVLGFGMGNYQDGHLETLADKGNGNYGYIDNLQEAKKMLVTEMGGTFLTIAKDVKIQIEFNPQYVASYRLIGYENRKMANRDFDDDSKDAGELGAGHSVTALYEIIPVGASTNTKDNNLRYQNKIIKNTKGSELAYVKFRYKKPDGDKSVLLERTVSHNANETKPTSDNYRFSAAVAAWGMLLRNSEYKGNATYKMVYDLAEKSKGKDSFGYRTEFLTLVQKSQKIAESTLEAKK